MKRKQIEEELRKEAELYTPDVYDRVTAARQKDDVVPFPAKKREREKKSRGGFRIAAICSAAALCLAIALPVCYSVLQSENPVVETPPVQGGDKVQLSVQDVYGLGAVTTVSLLENAFPVDASAVSLSSAGENISKAQEQAETFHGYFLMLESFLGDEFLQTTTEANTDEAFSDYEIKLTVTGKDLNGNDVSHLMYYTEIPEKNKQEENETEQEYSLYGVMVTEYGNYELRGERKIETETKQTTETEEELRIRAYPDISDRNTYVEMEQEISVEAGEAEKEYVYSVVKNGRTEEKTALKLEQENKDGKEELEYRIEFLSGSGKGEYRLQRKTEGGVTEMKVSCSIDGESGSFTISETEDGGYVYLFSDGEKKFFSR